MAQEEGARLLAERGPQRVTERKPALLEIVSRCQATIKGASMLKVDIHQEGSAHSYTAQHTSGSPQQIPLGKAATRHEVSLLLSIVGPTKPRFLALNARSLSLSLALPLSPLRISLV